MQNYMILLHLLQNTYYYQQITRQTKHWGNDNSARREYIRVEIGLCAAWTRHQDVT